MSEKIYLNLLILCGILFHGILGTLSEDDDGVSSKLLSRKKRVIETLPAEEPIPTVPELYYIVQVLYNLIYICNGIIVSPLHILTARTCSEIAVVPTDLQVQTGDINLGTDFFDGHSVVEIFQEGDLAILQLYHAIIESNQWHHRIEPDEEVIPQRANVIIAGWQRKGNIYRRRKAIAKTMGARSCQVFYRGPGRYQITPINFCTTMQTGARGFTHEDGGAALVYLNKLVGVLIFAGHDLLDGPKPDVFIRVNAKNGYYNWIKSIIRPFLYPIETLRRLSYDYHVQPQTLFYRTAGQNNRFIHPHPAHFSHPRPNQPPPPVIHV